MSKSGIREKMNGEREECETETIRARVYGCSRMHVCTHASVCTSLRPCVPAHVFLHAQCVFCTSRSYANNIKSSFTAGTTKTLRGEEEEGGGGV